MPDLTTAVDAAARAHFDRCQRDRLDSWRHRPDGRLWQWEDLTATDKHAVRSFVLPIVKAVLDTFPPESEEHPA
jgi:hypothetical protein